MCNKTKFEMVETTDRSKSPQPSRAIPENVTSLPEEVEDEPEIAFFDALPAPIDLPNNVNLSVSVIELEANFARLQFLSAIFQVLFYWLIVVTNEVISLLRVRVCCNLIFPPS